MKLISLDLLDSVTQVTAFVPGSYISFIGIWPRSHLLLNAQMAFPFVDWNYILR